MCGLLVYEHFRPWEKVPAGVWVHEVDLTSEAGDSVRKWISSAEYGSPADVSYDDFEPVSVNIILEVKKDGTFSQKVDKETYDLALKNAYLGFAGVFKDLVRVSFTSVGLDASGEISDEEIEALMEEAVGSNVNSYLKKVLPDIIPSYESLTVLYEDSGQCSVKDGLFVCNDKPGKKIVFDDEELLIDNDIYIRIR